MHNDSNMMRLARGECGIVPTYVHDEVTLNGVPLKRYQIVYAKTNQKFEKAIAEGLAARIADLSGDVLVWCDDSAPEAQYEILIGDTARSWVFESSESAVISAREDKLLLQGTNAYEIALAQRDFLSALEGSVVVLTIPSSVKAETGLQITFKAPCDCSNVTALRICGVTYGVVDNLGNSVTGLGGAWVTGGQVSVILDVENAKAYLQNGRALTIEEIRAICT